MNYLFHFISCIPIPTWSLKQIMTSTHSKFKNSLNGILFPLSGICRRRTVAVQ